MAATTSTLSKIARSKKVCAEISCVRYLETRVCWNARTQPVRENTEWFFEGDEKIPASRWKVRRIGDSNDYVCALVSGGGPTTPDIEKFDIGYVLRAIRDEEEVKRRSAPK